MSIKPNTADQLRRRMVDRFGSVRQFAHVSGIERTRIYPILKGESLPGLRPFVRMARHLGYSLAELADMLDVH